MNMFPNMNQTPQYGQHMPCGSFVHPGVYPQTSQQQQQQHQQPRNGTDAKSLHAQLQTERLLRESAERELHHLKKYTSDLTRNLQYSYWVISQLQQAIRVNNANQAESCVAVEASEMQERIDRLQKENDLLRKALQTNEVKDECKSEEKITDGFDVNEIYGTKNELLLMALNYDMTSRPKESVGNS
ncbi:hypothetical protein TELCIR_18091 [Teladorsagia circumcincta]|uniref:Uncharacterized protein n=1 Tax=Teladorsagia circumcincta TaxID=45464 RepID=A0A2G9TQZ7_TELCI|nr:hypothetical protein TELCIR_18091 [Teladorsagia circumcincta]